MLTTSKGRIEKLEQVHFVICVRIGIEIQQRYDKDTNFFIIYYEKLLLIFVSKKSSSLGAGVVPNGKKEKQKIEIKDSHLFSLNRNKRKYT